MPEKEAEDQLGIGGPKFGAPVIDPTANVIALNDAANKRQDDLRQAQDRYTEAAIRHFTEVAALRSTHSEALAVIRGSYGNQLAEAEAKRIDAIRAVDVNAVAVASERQAAAASVLATQVSQSAEALRALVASTAATVAQQLQTISTQFADRLTQLERSQYEGKGKQAVSDPMMVELIAEMKGLRESRAAVSGKSEGISTSWAVLLGVVALLGGLLTIGSFAYIVISRGAIAPPQVIYSTPTKAIP